jgi:hypothetical protein
VFGQGLNSPIKCTNKRKYNIVSCKLALLHKNTPIQYIPLNGITSLLTSSLKFRYAMKPQAEAVQN